MSATGSVSCRAWSLLPAGPLALWGFENLPERRVVTQLTWVCVAQALDFRFLNLCVVYLSAAAARRGLVSATHLLLGCHYVCPITCHCSEGTRDNIIIHADFFSATVMGWNCCPSDVPAFSPTEITSISVLGGRARALHENRLRCSRVLWSYMALFL